MQANPGFLHPISTQYEVYGNQMMLLKKALKPLLGRGERLWFIDLHGAMEAVMMGKRGMAEPVFSTVRIDDHLPAGHLLRAVDALLDTAFIRRIMAPHYSLIGRPSVDPELMMRMLLVGYFGGIRSERKLCAGMHRAMPENG